MQFTKLQKQAVGLDSSDLCELRQAKASFWVHKEMLSPLGRLQQDARQAGFELAVVSAYRDFSRQLAIWNEKACGKRDLLDAEGRQIDCGRLSNKEKLYAILRWSAIPGTSRHHWGSDVDIYDALSMPFEEVRLVPAEVEKGGPCAALHEWLSVHIANNESYGFFRPYNRDRGGVAPEMWHISYLPLSGQFRAQLTPELLFDIWQESELLLLEELKSNISDIWDRYIDVPYVGQPEWVTIV